MSQKKNNSPAEKLPWWPIPLGILIVAIFWLWNLWYLEDSFRDIAKRGQFGDQFGAANAFFSGLAFAGIIYTLVLQRKDLKMQREEMQMQREEMAMQREEFEQQNFQNIFFGLMKHQQDLLQRFKAHFYRMEFSLVRDEEFKKDPINGSSVFVNLMLEHRRILDALRSNERNEWVHENISKWKTDFAKKSENDPRYEGKTELSNAQNAYTCYVYEIGKEEWEFASKANAIDAARLAYAILYQKYSFALGPYFRHFYHILKFIKEAKAKRLGSPTILSPDKIKEAEDEFASFTQFIQASQSTSELYLTLFNSLNFEKALTLVRDFHILDNLEEEGLNGIVSEDIPGITFKRRGNLVERALDPKRHFPNAHNPA